MLTTAGKNLRRTRTLLSRTRILGRWLGLEASAAPTNQPGLIILQLDGLSREQFEEAVAHRRLPFLHKMIHRGYFRRMSFYSGLPSSTPAVQAEVMYGVKTAVPAFQFLHRDSGEVFRMFEGEAARTIARELLNQGEPLLKGGASYSNIYSGGSEEAQCCAETRSFGALLKRIRPWRLLITLLLYSLTFIRVGLMAAVELLVATGDLISGLVRREWQSEVKFVPMRVIVAIVLREWVRIVVKLSINSGTPIIYANLLGYDEQAHRRGPASKVARWGLRSIDAVIKDIFRTAHRSELRDYEVIVFSDHGHEAVRIYEFQYGKPIQQAVADALQNGPLADRIVTSIDRATRNSVQAERWMRRWFRSRYDFPARINLTPEQVVQNVIVTALGPLGHIYFPVRVSEQVRAECAARLVNRENVPLVLYRNDHGEIFGRNRRGLWKVPEDCSAICGPEHRFLHEIQDDLVTLCQHRDSGDLIISGWDPDLQPLTFVQEHGSHGSLGFRETRGFALIPFGIPMARRETPSGETYIRGVDLHRGALDFLHSAIEPDGGTESAPLSSGNADRSRDMSPPQRSPSLRHSLPSDHRSVLSILRVPEASQRASELHLKVMTYNAHRCVGMDGRCRPGRIAHVIAECGADVVALQEMDENRPRTGQLNQTQMIASQLGMYYRFFPVLTDGEERYGLAVISRYPITVVREEVFRRAPRNRSEARGALWVTVRTDAGPVHLINTHLGLRNREREHQVDQLLSSRWLGGISDEEPVIFCGDLNAGPRSGVVHKLQKRFHCVQVMANEHAPQATFASILPLRRIDYVLVSRSFSVESVVVPSTHVSKLASDHLPVCAHLSLHLPQQPLIQDLSTDLKSSPNSFAAESVSGAANRNAERP